MLETLEKKSPKDKPTLACSLMEAFDNISKQHVSFDSSSQKERINQEKKEKKKKRK